MGRRPEGWHLRQKSPGQVWTVYFSHNGRQVERSTGTRDEVEAGRKAAQIYAHVVTTEQPRQRRQPRAEAQLTELVAAWLTWLRSTLDPATVDCYSDYFTSHVIKFFGSLPEFTEVRCIEYRNYRLGRVAASTVRKELSAIRGFLFWCWKIDRCIGQEIKVAGVSKKTVGTPYHRRSRSKAIRLSETEIKKIIAALPEKSRTRPPRGQKWDGSWHHVRARFIVAYETGLRPALIDQLSVPEHYRNGARYLDIPPELDKMRDEREVPLSQAARKALDSALPEKDGVIFGWHDYRHALRKAAGKALPPDRAKKFCAAHLRSARITHWCEKPDANLVGVQHLAGHKYLSTTALYVRTSLKAAEEVVWGRKKRRS